MTEPALRGDLRHFFPSEVLQMLQLSQSTGRLELERAGERADVFVERGRPVFAVTSGGSVRIGELLVHRGVVSPQALEAALTEQRRHPTRRLGALLVGSGAVRLEQLEEAIHEVLKRILYGLLLWRDGSFRFVLGEQVAAEDIRLDLDLDRLILEGLRHADEARAAG